MPTGYRWIAHGTGLATCALYKSGPDIIGVARRRSPGSVLGCVALRSGLWTENDVPKTHVTSLDLLEEMA